MAGNTLEVLIAEAKRQNTKLVIPPEVKQNSKLLFECPVCGMYSSFTFGQLSHTKEPVFLCKRCMCKSGRLSNHHNHRDFDSYIWSRAVAVFYNVSAADKDDFAMHHIHKYSDFPRLRSCLTNGYPMRKEIHTNTYVYDGVKDPCHLGPYVFPSDWPDEWKCCGYTGTVHDLTKVLITELISTQSQSHKALKRKYRNMPGYIPVFLDEMFPGKAEILSSMIRFRIRVGCPDVYAQTGSILRVYSAKDLLINKVTRDEERLFFERNHIDGYRKSRVCLGLYTLEGELLEAMSFTRTVGKKCFAVCRFCSALDSQIVGGAGRLFACFLHEYDPVKVTAYTDIRFASGLPADTVWAKLGFRYAGNTDRKKYWADKQRGRLKPGESFPEKDKKKYECLYDMGNYVFVWEV